jgi:hypothetical protein
MQFPAVALSAAPKPLKSANRKLTVAFSCMSKEDQTLTLIKASYANPIHPPGHHTAKEPRRE